MIEMERQRYVEKMINDDLRIEAFNERIREKLQERTEILQRQKAFNEKNHADALKREAEFKAIEDKLEAARAQMFELEAIRDAERLAAGLVIDEERTGSMPL